MAARNELGVEEWPDPNGADERGLGQMPALDKLRRETVITTYTVIGRGLGPRNYPLPRFGPNVNDVRTLK